MDVLYKSIVFDLVLSLFLFRYLNMIFNLDIHLRYLSISFYLDI